jgi:group II intron reverse transcriptase/maturase
MPKSLFLSVPTEAQLLAHPRGPLKQVKPDVLFSMEALRRAWLKVRSAGGGAGVDGVTIEQFEAKLEANLVDLQKELLGGRYRPRPVKRLLAPKPNGGLRPLALWTLRDKVVQRVVHDCIEPYFERHFLPCSFGYRPGRNIAQVVEVVMAHRQAHRRWVANIDIKDCFDSLDSDLLLHFVRQQVADPLILKLIKAWLNARIFNELYGLKATAGASQGAVISPLLSNIYLHQVDLLLAQQQHALIRYADNMLIFCRHKGEAEQALQTAAAVLQQVRLEINPHKSGVVHFDQGFQFLGVFFLRNEYFNL